MGISSLETKIQTSMRAKLCTEMFCWSVLSSPVQGLAKHWFQDFLQPKEWVMLSLWVVQRDQQGTSSGGDWLETGWWVISSESMLTVISVYLFAVEIPLHWEVHVRATCHINLIMNHPSHLHQEFSPYQPWVLHPGQRHCSCCFFCIILFFIFIIFFCHLSSAGQWLGLNSSFLPSLCVLSPTHAYFSLPISTITTTL